MLEKNPGTVRAIDKLSVSEILEPGACPNTPDVTLTVADLNFSTLNVSMQKWTSITGDETTGLCAGLKNHLPLCPTIGTAKAEKTFSMSKITHEKLSSNYQCIIYSISIQCERVIFQGSNWVYNSPPFSKNLILTLT